MTTKIPFPAINTPSIHGGHVFTHVWQRWFVDVHKQVTDTASTVSAGSGVSQTLPIPKLTSGGIAGSITFQDGIITKYKAPT